MNSDSSDYRHMSNVLKGYRNKKRCLIREEELLVKVLHMTSFEKDVVNILAKYKN